VRRGQALGKKKRVVLPSCIVSKIGKTFPNPDGIYEGFHDVDSSYFTFRFMTVKEKINQ
jgi:hypothetical protein